MWRSLAKAELYSKAAFSVNCLWWLRSIRRVQNNSPRHWKASASGTSENKIKLATKMSLLSAILFVVLISHAKDNPLPIPLSWVACKGVLCFNPPSPGSPVSRGTPPPCKQALSLCALLSSFMVQLGNLAVKSWRGESCFKKTRVYGWWMMKCHTCYLHSFLKLRLIPVLVAIIPPPMVSFFVTFLLIRNRRPKQHAPSFIRWEVFAMKCFQSCNSRSFSIER